MNLNYNRLKNELDYSYNKGLCLINASCEQNSIIIKAKYKEIEEINSEIMLYSNKLDNLMSNLNHHDFNIIDVNNEIDIIEDKMLNLINYNLKFNFVVPEVIVKPFPNDILDIDIEEEESQLNDIISKNSDYSWICIKCGEINIDSETMINCLKCSALRVLELIRYKDNNSIILNIRRKKEKDLFEFNKKLLSKDISKYVIDLDWFMKWKSYINNDQSERLIEKSNLTIDYSLGVLPPFSSINKNLFDINYQLKPNLELNTDYILVNRCIWDFVTKNYKGKEIKCNSNIYDMKPTSSNNLLKHKNSTIEKNYLI